MPVERRLPHIVLTTDGGELADAGEGPRITVRRDDERRFTLTCPPGGEAEASAVFGPELLALLSDRAERCDAEVVDSWLFLYPRRSRGLVAYGRAEFHRWMLGLVAAVGASPLVRSPGLEEDVAERERDRSGRAGHGVKIAALLVACVLPLILATVPFWHAIAEQVAATLR